MNCSEQRKENPSKNKTIKKAKKKTYVVGISGKLFTEKLQKIIGNVGTKNISAEYELISLHYWNVRQLSEKKLTKI